MTPIAPSVIEDISESRTVMEGETVEFNCTASGLPMPTLTWYREDNEVLFDTPQQAPRHEVCMREGQ